MGQHECCGNGDIIVRGTWEDEAGLVIWPAPMFLQSQRDLFDGEPGVLKVAAARDKVFTGFQHLQTVGAWIVHALCTGGAWIQLALLDWNGVCQ